MEQSNEIIYFVSYWVVFFNTCDGQSSLSSKKSTIGIVDAVDVEGTGAGAAALDLSVSLCLFFVFESAPTGPWQTPEKPFTVQAI